MNNKEKDTFFADFDRVKFNDNDRKEVFDKLNTKKNENFSFSRFRPVVFTAVLGILTVFFMVLLSSPTEVIHEKQHQINSSSTKNIQTGVLLITDENYRAPLNIVYSYNPSTNSLNVLSVPRDLYVPILNAEGKEIGLDKMLHAYAYGRQEGVKQTLLNFFQVTDDSFSVLTEEEFIKYIDQFGGMSLDSGGRRLGGEEVLASLSIRDQLTENVEKEHYEILSAVLEAALEQPRELEFLQGIPGEVEVNTIKIAEKVNAEKIEGIYYYILEGKDLEEVKSSLKQ
ncbi:LCP family protein [Sutcliffiella horikoshii]|uniref:LCP family glycopolymer transferase n=1 Tax=Sutcliffiella horikoshii TaxID=79883 RepID=UPI003850DFB2